MKSLLATSIQAAVLGSALIAAPQLHAEKQGVYLFPAAGFYHFATREDELDEGAFFSLGLGYQFNDSWSTELTYLGMDTEAPGDQDVEMRQVRLDALYHLERNGRIQPFMAIGLGENEFEANGQSIEDTQLNLGTGIKVFFNDRISWRTDFRLINSLDYEEFDVALSTGVEFFFGRVGTSAPKVSSPKTTKPKDSDKDGVADAVDQCPMTPRGVSVDSKGCALDSDGDGIPDHKDSCPNTSAGAKVDEKGCYIVLNETREVNLEVKFANNSDVVPQSYYSEIKRVADFMTEYALTSVVIEGHTDDRGAASYNEDLSSRRASAVAKVLVEEFKIASDRVSAKGYGESNPIATNDTAEGRAENRRVVAVVSAKVEKIAE